MERRQAPVLAVDVIVVGRSAGARVQRERRLLRPALGAGAIRAEREIAIEPERKLALACPLRNALELHVALPLQIFEELDPLGILRGECGHFRRGGIAIWRGPYRPAIAGGILAQKVLLQRVVQRA